MAIKFGSYPAAMFGQGVYNKTFSNPSRRTLRTASLRGRPSAANLLLRPSEHHADGALQIDSRVLHLLFRT